MTDDDGFRLVADPKLADAILEGIRTGSGKMVSPEPFRALLAQRLKDPAFRARYEKVYGEQP